MPQSTAVKLYRHTDAGAPVLTGAPGSIAALLHACLVVGINASGVDSITRDGSTVTATVSAGHGLTQGVVVNISGAEEDEYNGNHRITSATVSAFDFELAASLTPATPATGALYCKMAPAGWERSFVSGDAQRAAFRSLAVDATGYHIYIEDTNNQGTRRAGVRGYEAMSDIDSGSNPFPFSPADDQWCYWYKGGDETTARDWALIADDKLFWLYFNNGSHRVVCCGDLVSHLPTDAYNCVVSGSSSATDDNQFAPIAAITEYNRDIVTGFYLARDLAGIHNGAPISTALAPFLVCASSTDQDDLFPKELGGDHTLPWPPAATGGVITAPVSYVEIDKISKAPQLRVQATGLLVPLHDCPFANFELVNNLQSTSGDYIALSCRAPRQMDSVNPQRTGQILIDIVGPWR